MDTQARQKRFQGLDANIAARRHEIACHSDAIHTHNDAIHSLNTQRNTYSLVCALPPELLAYIFQLVKASCQPKGRRFSYDWFIIAHVCHTWRVLALNCPELWTCIDVSASESAITTMIERSKKSPLRIHGSLRHSPNIVNTISQQVGRIQDLDLSLSEENILELLYSVENGLPSNLRVLRLRILPTCVDGSPSPHLQPMVNLDTQSQIPSLRVLHITAPFGCLSHYPTSAALTELRLQDIEITAQELLAYINGTPNLERLGLSSIDFELSASNQSFVELPNLSTIYMAVANSTSLALLGQLLYPTDTRISFSCSMIGIDQDVSDLMFMWPCLLGGCSCHHGVPVIDRLRVSLSEETLEVSFGTAEIPTLCSCEFLYVDDDSAYELYDKFSVALPLANVRYLQISSIYQPTPEEWFDFLYPLRKVETIQARFLGTHLLSMLLLAEGLLPNLQTIELSASSFGPIPPLSTLATSSPTPCLPNRPQLKSITLTNCQIDKPTLTDLSKFAYVECPFPGNMVYEGEEFELDFFWGILEAEEEKAMMKVDSDEEEDSGFGFELSSSSMDFFPAWSK